MPKILQQKSKSRTFPSRFICVSYIPNKSQIYKVLKTSSSQQGHPKNPKDYQPGKPSVPFFQATVAGFRGFQLMEINVATAVFQEHLNLNLNMILAFLFLRN